MKKIPLVFVCLLLSLPPSHAQIDSWEGQLEEIIKQMGRRGDFLLAMETTLSPLDDSTHIADKTLLLSWKVGLTVGKSIPSGFQITEDTIASHIDTTERFIIIEGISPESNIQDVAFREQFQLLKPFILSGSLVKKSNMENLIHLAFIENYPISRMDISYNKELLEITKTTIYHSVEVDFGTNEQGEPKLGKSRMDMVYSYKNDLSQRPKLSDYITLVKGQWKTTDKYRSFKIIRK